MIMLHFPPVAGARARPARAGWTSGGPRPSGHCGGAHPLSRAYVAREGERSTGEALAGDARCPRRPRRRSRRGSRRRARLFVRSWWLEAHVQHPRPCERLARGVESSSLAGRVGPRAAFAMSASVRGGADASTSRASVSEVRPVRDVAPRSRPRRFATFPHPPRASLGARDESRRAPPPDSLPLTPSPSPPSPRPAGAHRAPSRRAPPQVLSQRQAPRVALPALRG